MVAGPFPTYEAWAVQQRAAGMPDTFAEYLKARDAA